MRKQLWIYCYVLILAACGAEQKQTVLKAELVNSSQQMEKQPMPFAKTLSFRQQQFDVFAFNKNEASIEMFLDDEQGKRLKNFKKLQKYLGKRAQTVDFVTNAGIFNKDYSPTGLYIEKGKVRYPLNLADAKGNFFLKPNGVFFLTDQQAFVVKSEAFPKDITDIKYATQSGPLLVLNDTIHPAFNEGSKNVYIRSGVGVRGTSEVFFAISKKPVNFYDFASLFKEELGCKNALYLDGSISKMYLPELNRMDSTGNFSVMITVSKHP